MDAVDVLGRHCPRCSRPVATWGAIHLRCLGYRLRYVLLALGLCIAVPVLHGAYQWTTQWLKSRQEAAQSQIVRDTAVIAPDVSAPIEF